MLFLFLFFGFFFGFRHWDWDEHLGQGGTAVHRITPSVCDVISPVANELPPMGVILRSGDQEWPHSPSTLYDRVDPPFMLRRTSGGYCCSSVRPLVDQSRWPWVPRVNRKPNRREWMGKKKSIIKDTQKQQQAKTKVSHSRCGLPWSISRTTADREGRKGVAKRGKGKRRDILPLFLKVPGWIGSPWK